MPAASQPTAEAPEAPPEKMPAASQPTAEAPEVPPEEMPVTITVAGKTFESPRLDMTYIRDWQHNIATAFDGEEDSSIGWHARYLQDEVELKANPYTNYHDVSLWEGTKFLFQNGKSTGTSGHVRLGRMDHSAFYVAYLMQDDPKDWRGWSGAFGEPHNAYPEQLGKAVWKGAMVGHQGFHVDPMRAHHISLIGGNSFVEDESTLTYDFSKNTADFSLTEIAGRFYAGPESIRWDGIQVKPDGSFGALGSGSMIDWPGRDSGTFRLDQIGYVRGGFYGPDGKEFAGTFETMQYHGGRWLTGAFGGRRQTDEDE